MVCTEQIFDVPRLSMYTVPKDFVKDEMGARKISNDEKKQEAPSTSSISYCLRCRS